jgi:hypothetical protein
MEGSQPGADHGNGEGFRNDIPDAQTPGYSPGGILNPAIGRPSGGSLGGPFQISPQASRFINPSMKILDNRGGRRAGNQPQELFGEAATMRSIITPEAIRNLVETYQSMDEMKEVFTNQLEVTCGVIDVIRSDHNETFTESVVMN